MSKKVSIVLPVYNGSAHLADSVDSVLRQTYANFELIAVDDCSTDNSLELLKQYAAEDSRVKVIHNLENLKLPRSLNVGFAQAIGDYFTWTSDDNMFKDNAIECLVKALETLPNTDMVYSDHTRIDDYGNMIKVVSYPYPADLYWGNIVGASFMYTRRIAEKVGEYDPSMFLAEDYDYWIRISRYGTICHIPENLYFYREHSQSLTQTRSRQIGLQTLKLYERHFLYLYSHAKALNMGNKLIDAMFSKLGDEDPSELTSFINAVAPDYFFMKNIDIGLWQYCKQRIKMTSLGKMLLMIKHKLLSTQP